MKKIKNICEEAKMQQEKLGMKLPGLNGKVIEQQRHTAKCFGKMSNQVIILK